MLSRPLKHMRSQNASIGRQHFTKHDSLRRRISPIIILFTGDIYIISLIFVIITRNACHTNTSTKIFFSISLRPFRSRNESISHDGVSHLVGHSIIG